MNRPLKPILILLVLTLITLLSFGCDTPSTPSGGCDTPTPGNGGVCTESVRVNNTSEAKLYYPCDISSPVGATTMSSGWTATLHDISFLSDAVVKEGFVVLAMTPSNQMGMVTQWRQGHKACIQKLKDLNSSHNVLRGKIDTNKLQISGHSKGGGGTLWAAAELGSGVRSAIGMAPYQGTEYNLSELRSMKAATFIQAGGVADTLATPAMTKREYDALPNGISKCYKRHGNWGHLEWANDYPSFHTQLISEYLGWTKYYLADDPSGAQAVESRDAGVNAYEWIK